ncbi:NAD dependent epimerase/dehydratase family protein [Klebsiella pneumoniae]|uniref:NAD dependent epimerase/dehydratase family protein n=1 Tax=Klebsiella pneumoniae TaxID=573 RepID=A0A377V081_KLEPN|nr:NAD dependent epimerase/dehydratase family protein [Klebsiella pneumoniae]
MKAPGLGRLSFTINDKGDRRELDVRAWWHPHGMPGLIYWLLMIPAHLFIFRGMAQTHRPAGRTNLRQSRRISVILS